MNSSRFAFPLAKVLSTAALVAAVAACVTVKGGKEGRGDEKAAAALRDFARTVETRDADRIAAFYAKDAYSRVLDLAPRHATGTKDLRAAIAETLAPVAALHVEPVGPVRAWKDGDRAWTLQDFHVTGTLKDGRGFTVDVRYSAVWHRAGKDERDPHDARGDDRWLVEYEHFMGPVPVAKVAPAPATP